MRLISPLSPPQYSAMSPLLFDSEACSQARGADEERGLREFLTQMNPTQATWAPTKSLADDGHDIWNCGQRAPLNTTFENLPPSPAVDMNDGPSSMISCVVRSHGLDKPQAYYYYPINQIWDDRTWNLFLKMDSFNSGFENYVQDNSLPTLTIEMQLAINKIKPYLSSIKDLPILINRLQNLGVERVEDLKLLDFENDLQGVMKVIQCRKLKIELFKDVTMDENVDTTTVELESSPMTQSNALHGIPQLRRSVIKSLETGTLRNDDSLHFLRRVSKHTSYVITHKVSGFENYYFIILLGRKIEKQFPKEIQNKESELNAERISKSVLQLFLLNIIDLRAKYIKLYNIKLICIQTNSSHCRLMISTYVNQREMIVNSNPVDKILMDWPFLGKAVIFKAHFYYLTNKEETVINEFNKNIPKFLKFIQAEAEKERKDKDLQLRLMTIMKKNNKTNALITIVLFVMAIMKENADLMFITFEDTNTLDEIQSSTKINSTPVVACLGDIWSNPKCFVFVDKQCLWKHEPLTVREAIHIMFMSYYVFNINYPKELAGILQFIQSSMFNIEVEGNKHLQNTHTLGWKSDSESGSAIIQTHCSFDLDESHFDNSEAGCPFQIDVPLLKS
ncbi:hypothetical protein ACI65C_001386 [Semiaphis heraclei]